MTFFFPLEKQQIKDIWVFIVETQAYSECKTAVSIAYNRNNATDVVVFGTWDRLRKATGRRDIIPDPLNINRTLVFTSELNTSHACRHACSISLPKKSASAFVSWSKFHRFITYRQCVIKRLCEERASTT